MIHPYVNIHLYSSIYDCVQVRASGMANGVEWDNFPECLIRCHAAYCDKEGLSRSSVMQKKLLYFMFHGHYSWITKNSKKLTVTRMKPFIFFIHRKLVGGRSRFAAKVPQHFSKFIKLYERYTDEWRIFLMDKGEGNPPMEYLVAFEEGLRNYGHNVHSLGTGPFRSRRAWRDVAKWRKREAYIALARYLLHADTGYKQWDCFRFVDYTMRRTLGLTFEVRHLPLSDGKDEINFKGQLKFDWSKYVVQSKRRVKSEPGEYKPSKTEEGSCSTTTGDAPLMVFDVELGKLVPL